MAFSQTAPLRRALTTSLPRRPFGVRFWDGTEVTATEPGAPTLTLRTPQALAHALRAPGELGLGRAYVAGMIDVDDLDGALLMVDEFEPPDLSLGQKVSLAVAVIRACGLVLPPPVPTAELRLRGQRHTISRDRRAVRHHYDVGNDFFALFLDRSMTYSCAYFAGGAETLEEAQEAKVDLVCKKLDLREGERVLDVGCGWGSFVIHAAGRYGVRAVGITLAERQAELARERVHHQLRRLPGLRPADPGVLAGLEGPERRRDRAGGKLPDLMAADTIICIAASDLRLAIRKGVA